MQRWPVIASVLFVPGVARGHDIPDHARQQVIDGGLWDYFLLGAEHMVTGYDHLLFLFGVLFFLTRPLDILKYVTAFTVGHTVTLTSATWLGITANPHLVDAFIAVTVMYKGFENLGGFRRWLGTGSPDPLGMVFFFGLVHGFGLSTRLQQLPIAEGGEMLPRILSFNAGVEIGQIAALLAMFAALLLIRATRHFGPVTRLVNGGLIAAGALLLLMQLHAYVHERWPEDFATDHHHHGPAHDAAHPPANLPRHL